MTWKRAFHYTWRATLTFLLVSLPGIIPQLVITGLIAAWTWADGSDDGPGIAVIGLMSSGRILASLWVFIAMFFVFFKYAPEAFAEVLANREATANEESTP